MQVREIMTANPVCATPDTSLRQISQMMVEHDCGCIPIVEDMTSKKPIGTITDRDIAIRAFAGGQNPAELKASDAMTSGVETITPDASIEKCADVMEDNKIRRVVVVNDDGKVVGMVAQADIAEHGSNPNLVGNVVNEISDAPASPTHSDSSRMSGKRSFSSDRSFADESFSSERGYSPKRSNRIFRSRSFRGGDYESQTYRPNRSSVREETSSSFGVGSLLPLLAGIGISVAAKYYLGSKDKTRRTFSARRVEEQPRVSPASTTTSLPLSNDETTTSRDLNRTSETSSVDLSRTASASGSTSAASSSFGSSGSSGTSSSFGSTGSSDATDSFDSSISSGGTGRSDFGNQTSGGSADLSTFGDGDFESAGGDDPKPILEVGRNPGKI